jgi:hypothetical protein
MWNDAFATLILGKIGSMMPKTGTIIVPFLNTKDDVES